MCSKLFFYVFDIFPSGVASFDHRRRKSNFPLLLCDQNYGVWFFFVSRSFSPFFDLRLSKEERNKNIKRWQRGARGKRRGFSPAPLAARLSAYAILPKTPLFGPKHLFFLTFASSAYFQTNFGEFSRLNSKTAQEKSRTLRVQFSPKFSNHSPFFRLTVAASQI